MDGPATSPHLLSTLLADYWLQRPEYLPSAALVALLAEFGVSTPAARAALLRLHRRGLLETVRDGRHTSYAIAPSAGEVLAEEAYRFMAFGGTGREWDGHWTLAAFPPRDQHRELRDRLRWLGFAPLYDGVRASPRDVGSPALDGGTVFRAVAVPGGRAPISAWDLDEIAAMYQDFVNEYEPLRDSVHSGGVSEAEALLARTRIIERWRSFPGRDPDLPPELLPGLWQRAVAHEIFVDVYDALGPLAAIRVRQLLEPFAPELAPLVDYHTTASLVRFGAATR